MANTKTRRRRVEHVQAIETGAGDHDDGSSYVVRSGDILPADDSIVKKHPDWFGPIRGDRERPAIEQATAAPGERRG